MQAAEIFIRTTVRSNLDRQGQSQLCFISLSRKQRFTRACAQLFTSWIIAILCILIPVLHFALVPAGFGIGIYLFFRQMNAHQLLIKGLIHCPNCLNEFQAPNVSFNWPLYERCPNCQLELILEK